MLQTKRQSLIETLTNVAIGYLVSLIANLIVLPLFNYNISLIDGIYISIIFTVISIIRGYLVRRYFNRMNK